MKIQPIKRLEGTVRLKGDKSVSHRAVMAASLASGRSSIKNFPSSEDCLCTVRAFSQMGVQIDLSKDTLVVNGRGLRGLSVSVRAIHLGNSGTSMRLLAGILAGQPFKSVLTADESLSKRPMNRIIEPLKLMGADISGRDNNFAPLVITGHKLKAIRYKLKVPSAQVKSSILFAALYADGCTEIEEPLKSRDHTERILSLFGARMVIDGLKISIFGNPDLSGQTLDLPGDISSAAFFIAGALLLPGSEIIIKDVLLNRTRYGLIDMLGEMGADIMIMNRRFNGYEDLCDIVVDNRRAGSLRGITVEAGRIPSVIDELPILLVVASFAEGKTLIKGAGELRVKETDRIVSMVESLRRMGADISVGGDDIQVKGRESLSGADVDGRGDHRTVMSLALAALRAKGASSIKGADCVGKSFPDFFEQLRSMSVP